MQCLGQGQGIGLCNDNHHNIDIPCSVAADMAQTILNKCVSFDINCNRNGDCTSSPWNWLSSGQIFSDQHYNVIVGGCGRIASFLADLKACAKSFSRFLCSWRASCQGLKIIFLKRESQSLGLSLPRKTLCFVIWNILYQRNALRMTRLWIRWHYVLKIGQWLWLSGRLVRIHSLLPWRINRL